MAPLYLNPGRGGLQGDPIELVSMGNYHDALRLCLAETHVMISKPSVLSPCCS